MGDVKFTEAIKQTGSIHNNNVPPDLVDIPVPEPRRTLDSKPFEKDNENNHRGV